MPSPALDFALGTWANDPARACAQPGVDPELFFPDRGTNTVDAARTICGGCVVQTDCLAYAVARPDIHGVWGGTSDDQRRAMRRKRTFTTPGHTA